MVFSSSRSGGGAGVSSSCGEGSVFDVVVVVDCGGA